MPAIAFVYAQPDGIGGIIFSCCLDGIRGGAADAETASTSVAGGDPEASGIILHSQDTSGIEKLEVLMSSLPITVVVPYAQQESVFLLHAVEAALQAYRKNQKRSDQMNGEKVESVMQMRPTKRTS